jgi:hypothetical protein
LKGISIGREKSAVGSAGANRQFDRAAAFGAMAFIGRFVTVDVNARVNAATGEMDPDESTPSRFPFRSAVVADRQIEMLAWHD